MITIDFIVAGFSKCGTTTLCSLLSQHNDIFIPKEKEPWYFSAKNYEDRHQEYQELFSESKRSQLLGEGSTAYTSYLTEDISIERIKVHNPKCKFIFIARNPIKRIESNFRELHNSSPRFGYNTPFKLSDAMKEIPQILEDSKFNTRISKYYEAFSAEQILVIFLEDLNANPMATLSECFKHLGKNTNTDRINVNNKLNTGDTKLYDSKLLRYIRTTKHLGILLSKVSIPTQDKYLKLMGLRKKFSKNVIWDDEAIKFYHHEVSPDRDKFLLSQRKPNSFWPEFNS